MRRMFRRHIRKTLAPEIPPILQEANFAFDKGEYGHAGELFERLAQTASARGGPRAPLFHLKAGRARILAGQISLGMPSLKRGFQRLAEQKQFLRLQHIGALVVSELNERGFTKEDSEVDSWLRRFLPSAFSRDIPDKRPVLPTHCPSCGAGIRLDEVEWLDEATAECAYCGNPVRS